MAEKTVPLEAWFDLVLGMVPKANLDQTKLRIVDAVVEAAKLTRQLRHVRFIDAQVGVSEYSLPLDEGYYLALVETVCVLGTDYTPSRTHPCGPVTNDICPISEPTSYSTKCSTNFQLSPAFGPAPVYDYCGTAGDFYVEGGESLVLTPSPGFDSNDGIEVSMSVFPSRFACTVPETFYHRWKEEIGIGAAVKLLRNSSTYDRAKYQDFGREWSVAKNKMKNQAQNNFVVGGEIMGNEAEHNAGRKVV